MRILQETEIDVVAGGADAAGCYYKDQLYTVGATVAVGGGYYQTCMQQPGTSNYYWSTPTLM